MLEKLRNLRGMIDVLGAKAFFCDLLRIGHLCVEAAQIPKIQHGSKPWHHRPLKTELENVEI